MLTNCPASGTCLPLSRLGTSAQLSHWCFHALKHTASETPGVFIVSPSWPPSSWTVLQHSHALAGITRPLTPPHLVSSVCTLSSSVTSLPQPQPSIPSPIFKCPWGPSQFFPAWSWLMGGHWRSVRPVHPRRVVGGGVSSSGEVEGPGPLCPATIRNTGVGLLVWNSGPASFFLPCQGQIRRKRGELVMGGLVA